MATTLACYPGSRADDFWGSAFCVVLTGYPFWAGEAAIRQVVETCKYLPTIAEIKPFLEEQVRYLRDAWNAAPQFKGRSFKGTPVEDLRWRSKWDDRLHPLTEREIRQLLEREAFDRIHPPPPKLDDVKSPGCFANLFVPDNHARYASLVEWSKTSDQRLWKLGRSSDGRSGIWVSLGVWEGGKTRETPEQTNARWAAQVPSWDEIKAHYEANPEHWQALTREREDGLR